MKLMNTLYVHVSTLYSCTMLNGGQVLTHTSSTSYNWHLVRRKDIPIIPTTLFLILLLASLSYQLKQVIECLFFFFFFLCDLFNVDSYEHTKKWQAQ